MVWTLENSKGNETAKTRHRVIEFCQGIGFDVGPGDEKICTTAMGVGDSGLAVQAKVDLSKPGHLAAFSSEYYDYVYSSHALEDLHDTEGALREWWRVISPGGHLILYLPHRDLYPNVGQPGANPRHKHDFVPTDILKVMDKVGTYQVAKNEVCGNGDEYSFLLVLRKLPGVLGEVQAKRKPIPTKKALVIRYGGYGDSMICAPIFAELKRQSYHTTFNTSERGAQALAEDPNIDEFLLQERDQVDPEHTREYWDRLSKGYDRAINLSLSLEGSLLFRGKKDGITEPIDPNFDLPHAERHVLANKNYMDYALDLCEMSRLKGVVPTYYLSESEKRLSAITKARHTHDFMVSIVLGGSANHKNWPYMQDLVEDILAKYPEAFFITHGDSNFRLVEWDHPRVAKRCGNLSFRQSAALASICDLVITPETGLAWVTAGMPMAKIVLLSHSSPENLTRDWVNTYVVEPNVACHPCHQLHYGIEGCVLEPLKSMPVRDCKALHDLYPVCVSKILPGKVMERVDMAHYDWETSRSNRKKEEVAHA